MKRFHPIFIAVVALALSAAQGVAAPKKGTAKNPAPKPAAVAPADWAYVSSFMSYDVGTLQMVGKTAADRTYSVGPLQMTGRSIGATVYSIGTLSLTGRQEP
jgi:hypothetical protein